MAATESSKWKFVDNHLGLLSFLVTTLFVVSIWVLRFIKGNPVLFGEDIYNALILFSRVVALFSEMQVRGVILAVSLALTGFGISCLAYVVQYHIESKWMKRAIMGLVSITPAFISASASFSKTLIVFVFCIFILFCLTKISEDEKKKLATNAEDQKSLPSRRVKILYVVLSLIFSFLLGMLSLFAVIFVVLVWYIYLRRNATHLYLILSSFVGSILAYFLSLPLWNGTISIPEVISDFGAPQGIGVMVVLLAILSILFWDKQWSTRSLLITVPLGALLLFDSSVRLLFFLVIIVLAARTWEELFFQGWALPLVRRMSILVVGLSFAFSMLVFIDRAPTFSPTLEEHAALAFVAAYTPLSVSIFSEPSQAAYVRYYTKRTPVVHSEIDREYYEKVINSAYIKEAVPNLEERGVNVLYFSSSMMQNLPSDQRLRFLLTNERFKMLYLGNTTQAWMFLSRQQ